MWYYAHADQRQGPFDDAVMDTLIADGSVTAQTPVWKAGMQDWQGAAQTELAPKFAQQPPAVPHAMSAHEAPRKFDSAPADYSAESFHSLWLWFVWLLSVGLVLSVILIGIPAVIAAIVVGYVLLYRCWRVIQDGHPRTTPGKAVGFCFIPFFNIYWAYVAYVGLAQDTNTYCRQRQIAAPEIAEGLALAWFILLLCSAIPYLGILCALAAAVCQIVLFKQCADTAAAITRHKTPDAVTRSL